MFFHSSYLTYHEAMMTNVIFRAIFEAYASPYLPVPVCLPVRLSQLAYIKMTLMHIFYNLCCTGYYTTMLGRAPKVVLNANSRE
jgi:hypothetical protein